MTKLLLASAVVLAFGLAFHEVHSIGANGVQKKWDAAEKIRTAEINTLKGEIAQLEKQHTARQEELTNELKAATDSYHVALDAARDEYTARVSNSEARANVYQRQARGSALEQERLARHAAELDRSLEEGRHLVRELGETLRQREVTIRALGGIILNDRTLLESNNGT